MIRTSCVPVDAEAAVVGETQSAFSALPDGAVFPAGHPVQVSDDLAPKADENVSSGHVVHVDSAPHEDKNSPAPHFVQSEAPASANFPASQSEQVLATLAPKDEVIARRAGLLVSSSAWTVMTRRTL